LLYLNIVFSRKEIKPKIRLFVNLICILKYKKLLKYLLFTDEFIEFELEGIRISQIKRKILRFVEDCEAILKEPLVAFN